MPPLVASGVFSLIERIASATTIKNVWDIYMGAAREAGLEYGIACFLPDNKNIGETTFAQSFPDGWLEQYVTCGYQDLDPLIPMNHQAIAPFSWKISDWEGLLSDRQLAWRDHNKNTGILGGLNIPDRNDHHLKVIALCGSRTDPLEVNDRRALYYAGLEALHRMHDLGLQPMFDAFPVLSPRERECLQWLAAGKSDWEIGQILSISEKTVSTHVDRMKHKLGVGTRAQVLVAALRHGAISP